MLLSPDESWGSRTAGIMEEIPFETHSFEMNTDQQADADRTSLSRPEQDRSHLSIVRTVGNRREASQKNSNAISSLQARRRQKAEADLTEAKTMIEEARRILQREFIGKLPPEQGTVMWGIFSLKPEEQIAEEMGLSVTEVRRIRDKAERELGGSLNF